MDRLSTMRTFVAVSRLSSFRLAADELGISRTLVSRQIADLEHSLGVRLLNRTTRSVGLTPIGQEYHGLCKRILTDLEKAEEQIAASRLEMVGEIAVQCPIWLGSFGLSEAAASFCIEHPRVNVRINFEEPSHNPHDFLDREYDLCMQPTMLRDSSITVKKVGEVTFCLIASPTYLALRGEPEKVGDLARYDVLVKSGDGIWEFEGGTSFAANNCPRMSTNSVFSLCSGAAAGLGIALVPVAVAERFLNEGLVRRILPEPAPVTRPLYVAFAPGGDIPRRTRQFIEYLDHWFKNRPAR